MDETQHTNFQGNPLFRARNSTRTTAERWDPCLLLKGLFCCVVLVPGASGRLACSSANTGREGCTAYIPFSDTCTQSYIQPFAHTCTHCHLYSRFPTPVHTVVHTAVSQHLYTLPSMKQFPHTCPHCHTYNNFHTPVHTFRPKSVVLTALPAGAL